MYCIKNSGSEKTMTGDEYDDSKRESKSVERKTDSTRRAQRSDSSLSSVEREVREHYKPQAKFDSFGELPSIQDGGEPVSMSDLLSDASIGLGKFQIQQVARGFTGGDNRYMLGAEFAIVAIVAIAGIAKRRADLSDAQLPATPRGDESTQVEVIYQSAKLKGDKFKLPHGKDVPEWLISLDTSVAKEAGYLFSSVLKRPTVLMTMSDTFTSLAELHFHDAMLGWLIVDLNRSKLTETWKGTAKVVAVSNGETIELPVWEDIVEFYQNKPKNAKPDNLLTVVLKRNLDRELIEAALASVVVPGTADIVDAAGGDQTFRVTVNKKAFKVLRIAFENPNTWHKMERHFRNRRVRRSFQTR